MIIYKVIPPHNTATAIYHFLEKSDAEKFLESFDASGSTNKGQIEEIIVIESLKNPIGFVMNKWGE